jgi:hypothetical protein
MGHFVSGQQRLVRAASAWEAFCMKKRSQILLDFGPKKA